MQISNSDLILYLIRCIVKDEGVFCLVVVSLIILLNTSGFRGSHVGVIAKWIYGNSGILYGDWELYA